LIGCSALLPRRQLRRTAVIPDQGLQHGNKVQRLDKIAGRDFESPKGAGQDAWNNRTCVLSS
jgi:hypothetical protein